MKEKSICICGAVIQKKLLTCKSHLNSKRHQYFLNNKIIVKKQNEKTTCGCGLFALVGNLKRQSHINSKRHQAFLKTLETA